MVFSFHMGSYRNSDIKGVKKYIRGKLFLEGTEIQGGGVQNQKKNIDIP